MINWKGDFSRLNLFDVRGNRLNFSDLEEVDLEIDIDYAPQQNLSSDTIIKLSVSESLALECDAGGTNTTYQWFKNNEIILDANSPTLEFTSLIMDDQGDYFCEANNIDYPELTLSTGVSTIDFSSSTLEARLSEIHLYPNPTSEFLYVDLRSDSDVESVSIINLEGKQMEVTSELIGNQLRIDIRDFNTGLYFLNMELKQEKQIQKFQIIK